MAKTKDGITDLTRMMVNMARHLPLSQYRQATSTIFGLLNGVNYGYDPVNPQFLHDATDIRDLHISDKKNKIRKKHVAEIIPFKVINGGKDA